MPFNQKIHADLLRGIHLRYGDSTKISQLLHRNNLWWFQQQEKNTG